MTRAIRSAALARAALLLCLAAAAAVATPAQAATAHHIGGVIPDTTARTAPVSATRAAAETASARGRRVYGPRAAADALPYYGGPVLHHNRTHVVFWAPAGSGLAYDAGYQSLVTRFLRDVAADSHSPNNVYGLSGQYTDRNGPAAYASAYGGATQTTDPLPPNGCTEPAQTGPGWSVCLNDTQLQAELERVVAAHHLPRTGTDVYFLVLPNGFGNCTDAGSVSCALGGGSTGYCGYHSETKNGLLYAVIPYNAVSSHCQSENPRPNGSTADPSLSSLSHEHNEMVTDPDAYDGWIDANNNEDGDLCITDFGPTVGGSGATAWNEVIGGDHWYLQEEWSNEDGGCAPRAKPNRVAASVPARAVAGRAVSLSARAAAAHGTITGFRWFFGDGGTAGRRVSKHTFKRAGRYRVVLRVVDSAENWTQVSRTVVVRRR